jgi:hypothetical protein
MTPTIFRFTTSGKSQSTHIPAHVLHIEEVRNTAGHAFPECPFVPGIPHGRVSEITTLKEI